MKAFYSDTFALPLPDTHRFPMAKYQLLREQLIDQCVMAADDLNVPEPALWDDLRLVHDADYVERVASGTLPAEMQRRIGFPWSPEMVERSRRSVGATIAAARDVVRRPDFGKATSNPPKLPSGGASVMRRRTPDAAKRTATKAAYAVAANLAGGTHHAFSDRGEGYCVFNDVAVAARVLQRDGLIHRAVVVDCDVHQGNGTASIFRDDPSVFTLSLHGARNFPFRKEISDLDVTFDDGASDDEYLTALAARMPEVLDAHRPDLVFYLAGADPYEGDRLGRLKLTVNGLQARDRMVFSACRQRDLPIVVTMSGGYCPDVHAIVAIHVNTIREAVHSCRSVFAS